MGVEGGTRSCVNEGATVTGLTAHGTQSSAPHTTLCRGLQKLNTGGYCGDNKEGGVVGGGEGARLERLWFPWGLNPNNLQLL